MIGSSGSGAWRRSSGARAEAPMIACCCSRGQCCELIRARVLPPSMMESKVLVVGLGGVSCEICKNLILGGVGQVTLMDHQQVSPRPRLRRRSSPLLVTRPTLTSQLTATHARLRRRICRPTTSSPRTASGQMYGSVCRAPHTSFSPPFPTAGVCREARRGGDILIACA
jgi:hypothetical protein